MFKFNLVQKIALCLLFISIFVLGENCVFAQSGTIAWSPAYTLQKGHTIYLTGMDVYSGCGWFYTDINGVVSDNYILNDTPWDGAYSNGNQSFVFDEGTSPVWYTATNDSTIRFGMSQCSTGDDSQDTYTYYSTSLYDDTLTTPDEDSSGNTDAPAGEVGFNTPDSNDSYVGDYGIEYYFNETWVAPAPPPTSAPPTGTKVLM